MSIERDEAREYRIHDEAVVDAYGEIERALGWYYYLDGKIQFPFKAKCIYEHGISPLKIDEKVTVLGLLDEADCESDIFVEIELFGRTFGVPLSQLKPLKVNENTHEAIEDWHYWVARGYMF